MRLPGVELAALTGPSDASCIDHCSRPVESLPERIAHYGFWCGVVAANTSVDVFELFCPLLSVDASLHDPGEAPLIELPPIKAKDLACRWIRLASSRSVGCLSWARYSIYDILQSLDASTEASS